MNTAEKKEYAELRKGVPKFKDDGTVIWPEWRLAFETYQVYSGKMTSWEVVRKRKR